MEHTLSFQYVGYKEDGQLTRGKLSAPSEEAANRILESAGYQIISLRNFAPAFSLEGLISRFTTLKPAETILFYRQLALLLESGVDIVSSLELLKGQVSNRILRNVLEDVIGDIRNGHQLSAAMDKHPKVFSAICRRSLRVGEQTGGLEEILRQVADHMEKEIQAAKGLKGALTYPVIAGIVTIAVVGLLIGFVLPSFGGLYDNLGIKLPAITRFMLDTGKWLQKYGLFLVGGVAVITLAGYLYQRTASGRYKKDKMVLSLPLMGRITHLKELARACRSISILFRGGLPVTQILPLIIDSLENKVITEGLINVQQDILKGNSLSASMQHKKVFLPMMVQMVKVGEETGHLDKTLLAVAHTYETEAKEKTDALLSMIQPVMTIVIGGIIGLVALSMFSAMYSMYGQLST